MKLQGTLAPYTGDQFMASLNTLTTASTTAGNPSSKTAILPNPNLGGFTTSNPPAAIPESADGREVRRADVGPLALWPGLRYLADP